MPVLATILGIVIIILTLIDGFETILQPRRVTHRFRYARLYYRSTWRVWRKIGLQIAAGKRREAFLSIFGPLSLLGLFATWVAGLILGFGMLHWSLATALLDARAGSLPSAAQLLARAGRAGNLEAVEHFLREWEHWSAELLESNLSFPVLSYFRSQHDNQSWLATLTAILDTCALLMVA